MFSSEIDPMAQATYRENFGSEMLAGDIRDVDAVPDHDVLAAGFPCQPFSLAGVSKKNSLGQSHGFRCDTQGTMFFEIERIIRLKRPRAFILENVKNLISHDKGKTFRVIKQVLEEDLEYEIDFEVIDAAGFVPQHRQRLFIVGFREESDFAFDRVSFPDPRTGPKLSQILHPGDGSEESEEPYTLGVSGQPNPKYTLSPKLWEYLQAYAEKHRRKGNGFGYGLVGPDDVARTLSARYYKDGSEILIRQARRRPRRLTPRECARLMGFDSGAGASWRIPVSDTQAYRQFGNAVVPAVVEAIAAEMRKSVTGGSAESSKAVKAVI